MTIAQGVLCVSWLIFEPHSLSDTCCPPCVRGCLSLNLPAGNATRGTSQSTARGEDTPSWRAVAKILIVRGAAAVANGVWRVQPTPARTPRISLPPKNGKMGSDSKGQLFLANVSTPRIHPRFQTLVRAELYQSARGRGARTGAAAMGGYA